MTVRRLLIASLLLLSGVRICYAAGNVYHLEDAAGTVSMEECLKCHEHTIYKGGVVHFGNYCLLKRKPYPPAGKEHDFADRSELERAGCVLEEGMVTCLSCHDLTKAPPYVLRNGEKLCSICHLNIKVTK